MWDTVKLMFKDPFSLHKNVQEPPREMDSHLKLANCLLAWGSGIHEVALLVYVLTLSTPPTHIPADSKIREGKEMDLILH